MTGIGFLSIFIKVCAGSTEIKIFWTAELVLISSVPQFNYFISLPVRVMDYLVLLEPFIITLF